MKIAVVYNSPSGQVMQHRGPRAREVYPPHNVQRIADALAAVGHQVIKLEADGALIDGLQEFFGDVPDGQWPGLVFNIAFGMQGELRYCHVPGLLDMLGLPYLGSGPWGHALASDKAAAKALLRHHGLPTPDFTVMYSAEDPDPGFGYPLIVKPLAEASSLGVHLVYDEQEMRVAVRENLDKYQHPVLVEQFIMGRELNVSIIGNGPTAEALPPVEVNLGSEGLPIYTQEDKDGIAKRTFELLCPAPITTAVKERLEQLALQTFSVLRCRDWARVEFRLDNSGQLFILQLNTMPGLGRISSLPEAAKQVGLSDLPAVVDRLVGVAAARYQGGSL